MRTHASRHVVNLCFHGIGSPQRTLEPGEERYWIDPDSFLAILDTASKHPEVRLSFDDANASDVEIALPALRERELVATFHLLAGRVDKPGSLTADGARSLADAGMTIGNHGMDHLPWTGMDARAHHRELVEARDVLAEVTGSRIVDAALPLGRYDRRTLAGLRSAGYRSVGSSDRGWARPDAWMQPRYSICADDTSDSVAERISARGSMLERGRRSAVGLVKRWR
jgi:peptidoglycan/xylan/chitin deacetylase (PgdA/CDA1 family)